MKKFLKITGIIFISFLILCIVFSFADRWLFYHLWYFGDRITISLTTEIDDEIVHIDKEVMLVDDYGNDIYGNDVVKVKEDGTKSIISIPAQSYGSYRIKFNVDSIPFYLELYQFNWWDVQEIILTIYINTENEMVYYNVEHTYLSEEASKETIYYDGQFSLDDSYNSIWLFR